MAGEVEMRVNQRDWKRPLAWAIAAYLFSAVMITVPDRTIQTPSDILMSSLLLSFAYALIASIAGTIRTFLTKNKSNIHIPFYNSTKIRSTQAIGLFILGMFAKAFAYDLALFGVIAKLFCGFACVQRLWPDARSIDLK